MNQNLLEKRQKTRAEILENKFIRRVLGNNAKDIDTAQRLYMSSRGFQHNEWYDKRGFNVQDNNLEISVMKAHRFADMKTIARKKGRRRKKAHPLYNKIIWGHYNNVVREMAYGYTEAVKAELMSLED